MHIVHKAERTAGRRRKSVELNTDANTAARTETPESWTIPADLRACLGAETPTSVVALGNRDILSAQTLALFCSVQCPGRLILQTYDLALALQKTDLAVAGGFHTPMEKECLTLLLRGTQPVVVCPARSIAGMRVPAAYRKPLTDGRLLLLSPFEEKRCRVTAQMGAIRNRFVAALADEVFVAHAAAGSRTEQLCREVLGWGKPLLTLDRPENAGLVEMGAVPVTPETVAQHLANIPCPHTEFG